MSQASIGISSAPTPAAVVDLSVVIVNWRSTNYVRVCLNKLAAALKGMNAELIVVDGGSFDGCGEMLAEEFSSVKFIQSAENVGFGRSNNLGFQNATGRMLLLLNPDTEVAPDAIRLMLSAFEKMPNAGIVGARLLNTDGTLQTSCVRALPTPLNRAMDSNFLRKTFPRSRLWGTWDAFRSSDPIEVEAISGACMLLSSETFRKVGGFSPQFFMYGEDMDLCCKVRRAGFSNYYVPGARIVHHGGGSTSAQASEFTAIKMRESAAIYMRLNHGNSAVLFYRVLQGLSALFRLGLLLLALPFSSARQQVMGSMRKWRAIFRWAVNG